MSASTADRDQATSEDVAEDLAGVAEVEASDAPEVPTRAFAWLLLVGGAVAALAAFMLTVEKIALISDPSYVPTCSINPVLNCGSVMDTAQAELFGFPNSLIGLAAFPVLMATGAALLAGARFRGWYWLGLQAGATLGLAFVGWLAFQSLYRIDALCPYCMVVWAVVIPVFWAVTAKNAAIGTFGDRFRRGRVADALDLYLPLLVAGTFLVLVVLIGVRFWDYWSTAF